MPKPLAGIRVIELANFIAGPLAGTLLADMGADVVKIEPPQGDMGRATPPIRDGESVSFVALNRNKRSLVLDLKQPAAREILLKLAATSDVVLEAYRPGALEKMGLGAADVKEKFVKAGLPVVAEGPDVFRARIAREVPMYREIIDKAGLKIQ